MDKDHGPDSGVVVSVLNLVLRSETKVQRSVHEIANPVALKVVLSEV